MDDAEKLTDEIVNRHKESFEIKAQISEIINGHTMANILPAFIMVYTEILMNCCVSEDEALDQAGDFAGRVMVALKAFSNEGLCSWNKTGTLQ